MSLRPTPKPWRLALGALCALLAVRVAATTLELEFVDTEGQPVNVAKAELLLVGWGETQRIALESEGQRMRLAMDADWLRSRWPIYFDYQEGVYLYLQAHRFASIRSERFKWPGAGGSQGPTTIGFPNGQEVVLEEGSEATATITFRPKTARRVRIVDPDGVPLANIGIDVAMFWSQSNHCAALAGAEPLGSPVSDAAGWIEVEDGDFEYVLELQDLQILSFVKAEVLPWRLVAHLSRPEAEVVVRRAPSRPLEIVVHRAGEPFTGGLLLYGYWDACPCGACDGPIARSDNGRIRLEEFHPDVWRWVSLLADDGEVWRAEPATTVPEGVIEIDLATATRAER